MDWDVCSVNFFCHCMFLRLKILVASLLDSLFQPILSLVSMMLWSLCLCSLPVFVLDILVNTCSHFSSIVRGSIVLTMFSLTNTKLIALSSVLVVVTRFLVTVPWQDTRPLAAVKFCLFIISARSLPFLSCWCGSFGIYSFPSLLLTSASMNTDLPASSALTIYSSNALKKGSLRAGAQFSWGP